MWGSATSGRLGVLPSTPSRNCQLGIQMSYSLTLPCWNCQFFYFWKALTLSKKICLTDKVLWWCFKLPFFGDGWKNTKKNDQHFEGDDDGLQLDDQKEKCTWPMAFLLSVLEPLLQRDSRHQSVCQRVNILRPCGPLHPFSQIDPKRRSCVSSVRSYLVG